MDTTHPKEEGPVTTEAEKRVLLPRQEHQGLQSAEAGLKEARQTFSNALGEHGWAAT